MRISNLEEYGRKSGIATIREAMFNLFKAKKGYMLVGMSPKAYDKKQPFYERMVF